MNIFSNLIKIFMAFILFSVTYLTINGLQGLLLGIFLSIFLLFLMLVLKKENNINNIYYVDVSLKRLWKFKWILLIFVAIISISFLYIVLPIATPLYIPPENIQFVNWIRLFSSILLTTFLPGYLILEIICNNQSINQLYRIMFSYIISIFASFIVGYIIILSGNSISEMGIFGISIFNISVLIIYIALLIKHHHSNKEKNKIVKDIYILNNQTLYITFFLIIMICLIVVITYMQYGSQLINDQKYYHGLGILLDSIKLPQDAFAFPSNIWLFGVYFAMFFTSSGIPSINAYNSLNFLNIIPIITFFLLVKSFFKNQQNSDSIAVLCTFFAFFSSGFGWIYALKDILNNNISISSAVYQAWLKTYDILTPNSFVTAGHPDPTTPLLLIGLPSMFILFLQTIDDKNSSKLRYFLIIIAAVTGYLGHTETIIMIITVAIISLTKKDSIKTLFSLIIAFLIIFVIDGSSPSHFYSTQGIVLMDIFISFPTLLLLTFVGLILIYLTFQKLKIPNYIIMLHELNRNILIKIIKNYGIIFISSLIFIIYIFTFIIWGSIEANFNVWLVFGYNGSVPWYFYPLRLGIVGIIALTGILYWAISRKYNYLAQLVPLYIWLFIPIFLRSYYLEYRLTKQFSLPVSIIAGFVLYNLISKLSIYSIRITSQNTHKLPSKLYNIILNHNINGKNLISILLLVIIISSTESNLLSIRVVKDNDNNNVTSVLPLRQPLTTEELSALTWLKLNIDPMTDTVLFLPDGRGLGSEVVNLGGALELRSKQYVPFFEVNNPDNFFNLCYKINAKYVYLNWQDKNILNTSERYVNSFVNKLLPYLPVVFNNSKVTIYKFPNFTPTSKSSSMAFIIPSSTLPITTIDIENLNYSIINKDDPTLSNYNTLVLSSYPSSEELNVYTKLVVDGCRLIILAFPPSSDLVINSTLKYEFVNGITKNNTTIQIPEIKIPYINETMLFNTKIYSDIYYTFNGKRVLPFEFTVNMGKGTITYLNFHLLFDYIQNCSDKGGKRLLFSKLGEIFELLELKLPQQQTISNLNIEPYCFIRGSINSTGKIILNTDSFRFIDQKPLFGTVDLSNVTIFNIMEGNEILSKNRVFNATLLNYQISGQSKTIIQTSYLNTPSLDGGAYSTFEIPGTFNMIIKLANNSTLTLTLLINKIVMKLSIVGGSLAINVLDPIEDIQTNSIYKNLLQICTKNPNLLLTGRTYMQQAYLSEGPYSLLVYGYPAIIFGTTSFQIESIDNGIFRISNLNIIGKLSSQIPAIMWNEWNIPWDSIFISFIFLIFVIFMISVILIYRKINLTSQKRPEECDTERGLKET